MTHPIRRRRGIGVFATIVLITVATLVASAQRIPVNERMKGFDAYMEKLIKDWNVPGIGVGIVAGDQVVLAKGYGYRDVEKKLPVTPRTLYQIASNTKLFTTMAAGFLVEENKLAWDLPVRRFVPSLTFFNDELNNTVTIRDMLAHRTGISRHDMIWYKADLTRRELFDRVRYLEPSQPLRQGFLYNNMMYVASGYAIELLGGKTWEQAVRDRIFTPLGMSRSGFSVADMEKDPDHAVPYNEKRDTTILYRIPIYQEGEGVGPAGSIISSVEDMSKWLIALMHEGRYGGKQILPAAAIKATLSPSIALPNTGPETRGFTELLNPVYGMGRWMASYRGHFVAYHGGDLDGFHSQISTMPYDSIGVIVFVIGDHGSPLYNVVTWNVYERLLGLSQTPWSERRLEDRNRGRKTEREGRAKGGAGRITGTKPSHPLDDYAGEFEHPAYGVITITRKTDSLRFDFHKMVLPLTHFHYDRFDTPNDEQFGLWSLNFQTASSGDIDGLVMSLDEGQVTFTRRADASLSDPAVLARYAGKYQSGGSLVDVVAIGRELFLVPPGSPRMQLLPAKPGVFRVREFGDLTFTFVSENGIITSLKQNDPSGEYVLPRKN